MLFLQDIDHPLVSLWKTKCHCWNVKGKL